MRFSRIRFALGVAIALAGIAGCAYHTPTEPLQIPVGSRDASLIVIDFASGTGAKAGTATITARVLNDLGNTLVGQTVTFTTDTGSLTPIQAVTDKDGRASTVLTASTSAKVRAATGSISIESPIAIQPAPGTLPPAPPPVLPPAPAPPPTAPPPSPGYAVTVVASPTTVVAGNGATLTATATPQNGAPAPASYAWDCNGDGTFEVPAAPANSQACAYNSAGTIHSSVKVTGGSVVGIGTVDVTVLAGATLAVSIVPATYTPTIGVADVFTATVTSAGPVPPTTLQWEWDTNGDGTYDVIVPLPSPPGPVNALSITFGAISATPSTTTVKVRVTDTATGRTAIGTVVVTVS